jgi:hypothetical protein
MQLTNFSFLNSRLDPRLKDVLIPLMQNHFRSFLLSPTL